MIVVDVESVAAAEADALEQAVDQQVQAALDQAVARAALSQDMREWEANEAPLPADERFCR